MSPTYHAEQLASRIRTALGGHNDPDKHVVALVGRLVRRLERLDARVFELTQDAAANLRRERDVNRLQPIGGAEFTEAMSKRDLNNQIKALRSLQGTNRGYGQVLTENEGDPDRIYYEHEIIRRIKELEQKGRPE